MMCPSSVLSKEEVALVTRWAEKERDRFRNPTPQKAHRSTDPCQLGGSVHFQPGVNSGAVLAPLEISL